MLGRKYKNYRPAAINCFYESPAAVYVLVQKNRKCLTARHRKYSMADKIKTATARFIIIPSEILLSH